MKRVIRRFRNSLFFVPALFIVGSGLLAWITVRLDGAVAQSGALFLLPTSVAGARAVLATIAGATITVAALVFSLTAVTVQLAASQYSPRLLKEFLRDRFQQVVVGVVVGTFSYSLIALGTIGAGASDFDGVAAPWSATVATVLGIATVIAIVAFIDHLMDRLNVDSTVRRISAQTASQFREYLDRPSPHAIDNDAWSVGVNTRKVLVAAPETGWVQRIDPEQMLHHLGPGDAARVDVRAGEYVVKGEPLLTVWINPSGETSDEEDAESVIDGLSRAVSIGGFRTIDDDPGFGLRQLVDIALRALSPGVNDPTTAGDVLHHLVEPLRILLAEPSRRRVLRNQEGATVALPRERDNADFVREALSEIRLAGSRQPHVMRALIKTLTSLRAVTASRDAAEALDQQFRLAVTEVGDWGLDEVDAQPLHLAIERYREVSGLEPAGSHGNKQ